jgi:hypothetical protein
VEKKEKERNVLKYVSEGLETSRKAQQKKRKFKKQNRQCKK